MTKRQYKTPNKVRGSIFERNVRHRLEEIGFLVFRSAGSLGVDLIAISPNGKVYLIECKISRKPRDFEIDKWSKIASQYGAHYLYVNRNNLYDVIKQLKTELKTNS